MNKHQPLDPRRDIVFKYLYTMYGDEAAEARNLLLSTFLGREIIDSVVLNNELPVDDVREKAGRLDINCTAAGGLKYVFAPRRCVSTFS